MNPRRILTAVAAPGDLDGDPADEQMEQSGDDEAKARALLDDGVVLGLPRGRTDLLAHEVLR